MLTTGVPLSGALNYLTALTAPGNARSPKMPRNNQGPITVPLPLDLTADCKVVRLHEKPLLDVRSKPMMTTAASMVSVYAAHPVPAVRSSSEPVKIKKRSTSLHQAPRQNLLQKRTNSAIERRLDVSPLRKSVPSSSTGSTPTTNTRNSVEVRKSSVSPTKSHRNAEKKVTKVYLSQKQSSQLKDGLGAFVPSAPPATPTPEHLKYYDYVPSLTDIMSQRHMQQRLEGVQKTDQKKADRLRMEQLREEKQTYKERIAEEKRRQRQEIYALNKVMTDLEAKQFEELVRTKGLNE